MKRSRHSARPLSFVSSLAPLAALLLAACGGDSPPALPPPAPPTVASAPIASATPRAPLPPLPPLPDFENPGGMWMPEQMLAHADTLKKLGIEIDPKLLADPLSSVLGSVVSLGGCSASFVSSDGLVITNHHCATAALQYNSTANENLQKTGFFAKSRAEEKWNGPTARVLVTQAVVDVTADVMAKRDAAKTDRARYDAVDKAIKDIVAACEKGRPEIKCGVSSFYDGAKYYRVEQLEIRDVRLAYAPAEGIGNFGGEIDNWRWPRHAGDVSLLRAYVGKDGKPADHADDNVPYHPPHHLSIAQKPLQQGDLVFVAGYPAHTSLLVPAKEVEEAVTWGYPRRIKVCDDYLAVLADVGKNDPDAAVKGNPYVRRFGNTLTNAKGELEALTRGGLLDQKRKEADSLRAFINADRDRAAKWGKAEDEIAKTFAEEEKTREADAELATEIVSLPKLVGAAVRIVRMADERSKKDADREPEYQERNWKRVAQTLAQIDKQYNRALDEALLEKALLRALLVPAVDRSGAVEIIAGKNATPKAVHDAVHALYEKTTLTDGKARADLFDKGTNAQIAQSSDSLVVLARKILPLIKASEAASKARAGHLYVYEPLHFDALHAMTGKDLAPDANSTLRLTYGTVRGYTLPGKEPLPAFTFLPEVVAKADAAKDQEPFDAPQRLLDAARAHAYGTWIDPRTREVPVDFVSDLHITGGNSGSPTLDARGNLVGLAFDGNYEALGSDWMFMPKITRTIHVDIRYIAWLLDAVDGGDALLKEMGLTPSVN